MIIFPFDMPAATGAEIVYRYNMTLVFVSYAVAAVASILAMYLAEGAKQFTIKRDQHLALLGGAVALGAATWSMHFIGMLAFQLCVTVKYSLWITILSIFPALIASWFAMHWLYQTNRGILHLLLGGTLVGAGIGFMHYSGMLAMQTQAAIGFEVGGVLFSVLDAVALATLALWFRHICDGFQRLRPWRHVIGGLVMGAGITIMHYVGMASARFVGTPEFSEPVPTVDHWYVAMLIALGAMALVGAMSAQNMIARQRQLSRELHFKERQMRVIFQNAIDAIVITDHHGVIQTVNRSFEELFGFQAQYALGKHVSILIPEWGTIQVPGKLRRQTDISDQWIIERNGKHANGHDIPLRIALVYVQQDDQDLYVGFLMDMTQIHEQQQSLEKLLTEDPLTGLLNRRGMLYTINQWRARESANAHGLILLFIDLDGFKAVNDRHGHPAGDEVLVEVSRRIQHVLRQDDIVCRFGGDEFLILIEFARDAEHVAREVADKLVAAIAPPQILSNGAKVEVGCSIGIAYGLPGQTEDIEILLDKADAAMYQAKKTGGEKIIFYT